MLAVSLDLSAAFDTVSHDKLLTRLEHSFGITGTALSWTKSYLSGRSQFVCVDGKKSLPNPLSTGVPQGSVLGPVLFSIFTAPIFPLISSFGINHQQYADDTLVYTCIPSTNFAGSVLDFEHALSTLCLWCASNGLSVNPSKSEAIIFSTRPRLLKLKNSNLNSVKVLDSTISISDSIKTLGVTLDSTLSFDKHCSEIVQCSLFHLRSLRHIRPLLSARDAEILGISFVQSRLDYCNSLLSGTSVSNVKRLQRIQNSLARLTFSNSESTHTSHLKLLHDHHWLPISQRIKYKISSITHIVLLHHQPCYLSSFLKPYSPARNLRSSDSQLLTVPKTHLSLTNRSFSVVSPFLWNSLPITIRTSQSHYLFCKQLKTELFKTAF